MNKNKKIKFPDWMSLFPFFILQLILYPIALYTRKVIIEINSASPILVFLLHFFEFAIFFVVTLTLPLIVFLGSLILIYIFLILIFNMKELLLLIGCCIVFGLGLLVK